MVRDTARSDHPGVQRQFDRLQALGPGETILGLERINALLNRLDNPQRRLPPVFHVAGTNGKGSTCAFLRAMLEAAGHRVHVYTSPHLVRFNERIRVAGSLIDDDRLTALLTRAIDASAGLNPGFFEVTTAAAFMAFAETPADACILETGLGGRLDATNVLDRPLVNGIAQIGIDHQAYLGETLAEIAGEKAGIACAGVPLVSQRQSEAAMAALIEHAAEIGALLMVEGRDWDAGALIPDGLPLGLNGAHQRDNAALAAMMLNVQTRLAVPRSAVEQGARNAHWPGRLQRLPTGALRLRPGGQNAQGARAIWVDGVHNGAAAPAIARAIAEGQGPAPGFHLILGILQNKDAEAIVGALAPLVGRISFIAVPDHASHDPEALALRYGGQAFASLEAALAAPGGGADRDMDYGTDHRDVLIAGSLYLVGAAMRANGAFPE